MSDSPEIQPPRELPPPGIPAAEVEITDELVRGLLRSQHPDLADQALNLFGSGWDNTTYRLGSGLAVRLPRRQLGAEMILKEQRWVPVVASGLPIPVGLPIRVGQPEFGYPWTWSVIPWIDGVSAEVADPDPGEAARLGQFLNALHKPGADDGPRSSHRGCPLTKRARSVEERLPRLDRSLLDVSIDQIWDAWQLAKTLPIDREEVWLHGDLHARNIIVDDGQIAGVIDWGDICVGDPATDLSVAWMLFPDSTHDDFRRAYGPISEATWERARGWAIFFGVVMVDAGASDDPVWARAGARTLARACG
ncbi:MAG: aminoglycoside phosphotransferase family protein [Acidimicrobiia bacterium]|nr:aminoglycoside phosphotransferase family protein [Acidimicrobiia bacterium]